MNKRRPSMMPGVGLIAAAFALLLLTTPRAPQELKPLKLEVTQVKKLSDCAKLDHQCGMSILADLRFD